MGGNQTAAKALQHAGNLAMADRTISVLRGRNLVLVDVNSANGEGVHMAIDLDPQRPAGVKIHTNATAQAPVTLSMDKLQDIGIDTSRLVELGRRVSPATITETHAPTRNRIAYHPADQKTIGELGEMAKVLAEKTGFKVAAAR